MLVVETRSAATPTATHDRPRIVATASAPSREASQPTRGSVKIVSPSRVNSSGTAASTNGSARNVRRRTNHGPSFDTNAPRSTGNASSPSVFQSPSRVAVIAKIVRTAAGTFARASARCRTLSRSAYRSTTAVSAATGTSPPRAGR